MALPERTMSKLPQHVLEDILERLQDARDIAKAKLVCKEFWEAGNCVRSLRFVVLDEYHERDRGFKTQMVKILKMHDLVQLRVEIESKLQAKTVLADERQRTDFWMSDPCFLMKWLPGMGSTLQHLSIVDYGQQAIMRKSSIVRILSQSCKRLKSLDLRNMFLDTSDCEKMLSMASLTLCSVKVTDAALQHINDTMPKLHTSALLGVFGVQQANFTCREIKALFLGLSTPANDITLDLPKLEELQLKMQCPQKLIIKAPALKYVAFNLDVLGLSKWELKHNDGLIELVYETSSFITLSSFAEKNPNLEKFFFDIPCVDQTLDIPCMALLREGRYLDILNDTPVNLPSFTRLHECGHPEVAPGLWQWKRHIPDGLNLQVNPSGT